MSITEILQTKLFIPPPRPELVPRPRLIEHLNKGLHRKLTLISAPAGFGKSTLLSHWLETLAKEDPGNNQENLEVGWISLDEDDNDIVHFLTYFIAAIRRAGESHIEIGEEALSLIQSPQPPPVESLLTSLINEMATFSGRTIVCLDDYHLIDSSNIDEALQFLINHQPPQLHLVIATRVDPQLPLARLLALDLMTEIRASDLRFTLAESADFLNRVMDLNLTKEAIDMLDARTEGWIAGLQLAGISMRGLSDIDAFIRSFRGSHQIVLDYLVEEVLDKQSASVQEFLMQTSILNRMTGSLCDAITGQRDSHETLRLLERDNLFIVPLDNDRKWYRYHHLFAGLLRQRLQNQSSDQVPKLHAKAVVWHEDQGNLSEAIHHALAGGDSKTATRLMEKGSLEALGRSEIKQIMKWVDLLPEGALESSPGLFIYHTWALLLTGNLEGIETKLEAIENLIEALDPEAYDTQKLQGYFIGLKAIMGLWQRNLVKGLELANQALELLPENNWVRGYCAIVLGSSYMGKGNLQSASQAYASAAAIGESAGNRFLLVSATCNQAYMLEMMGQVRQSVEVLNAAITDAKPDGKELPVAGYGYIDLARPMYHMNELDSAQDLLERGIEKTQRLADRRAEMIGHSLLARVHLANGKFADAQAAIGRAFEVDPSPGTPFDLRGGEQAQVWLWLKQGKFNKMEAWLRDAPPILKDIPFFKNKMELTMHARVMIALASNRKDPEYLRQAIGLLDELNNLAAENGWGTKVIEILNLQALAYWEGDYSSKSEQVLEEALNRAEPESLIRLFVDEGKPMAALLQHAISRSRTPEFIRTLLKSFMLDEPRPPLDKRSITDQTELVEPLSERELEVLHLIAEGLTNRDIGERLYLSLNTIKVHTRNIYGKLGVNNRTQAVAHARDLGFLATS